MPSGCEPIGEEYQHLKLNRIQRPIQRVSYWPAPLNSSTTLSVSPLRFQCEEDLSWDASEYCAIHADLTHLCHGHDVILDSSIFTNTYVRVAYDSRTLGRVSSTRRVERLYSFVHDSINHLAGMPRLNPQRLEQFRGKKVKKDRKWNSVTETTQHGAHLDTEGSYYDIKRIASPWHICRGRELLLLNNNPKPGDKRWIINVSLPAFLE